VSRKLQEKQARRLAEEQRKKDQRKAARRRNLVTAGIAALVAIVVVGLIVVEQTRNSGATGVAQGEAGCGDIEQPESAGRGHVADGTPVQYETSPPTSGQHWEVPAEARFYPPDSLGDTPSERFVHNLEHGQVVIWYSPDAPQGVIDDIENYIRAQDGEQQLSLLATPYTDEPQGYNLTVTAWTASQSCEAFSPEVVDAFREQFQGKGPELVGVPTFTASD
jgi:Protein of unknown function (DUF3105)